MSKDDIFRQIIDILDGTVADFWMDAGTCLAIVRKGDFIAETDDIDIGIYADLAHLESAVIREFEAKGFKLAKVRTYKGNLMTLGFSGPEKLDLFFYHEKGDYLWHTIYGWEDKLQKRKVYKPEKFSAHLFSNLKDVMFKDRRVSLPNPPETYLTERYGLDWNTPNPNYRFWRDSKAIDMEFV